MFTKMMVPLDGSEVSEGILPYVSHMAEGLNIPVTLMTVLDKDEIDLPARGGVNESEVFEALEQAVRQRLERAAASLRDVGVQVDVTLANGHPAEQIVETARREDCDIIAMSTNGRNMIARGILGSVTDKVMHSSGVPVLAIAPERARRDIDDDHGITSLLVPLDGSEMAEEALPVAADLATAMSLRVTLVRAVRLGGSYAAYMEGMSYANARIQEEIEAESAEYLEETAARLRDAGITADWRVATGAPAVAITETSRDLDNDIIVMATHGRSGLNRFVLGSVAEALIRGSGVPVLALPSQAQTTGTPIPALA